VPQTYNVIGSSCGDDSAGGNYSCARGSGSHLHLMTVQCPRKSLVSCIVPLTTAFMSSSRGCLHLIAQASQPFAMVEPTYVKSGWLSRRLANSMCWWRQEAGLAISCSSNLANCRTRQNPDLFRIKSKSVWPRSTLASPRANLECERTQLVARVTRTEGTVSSA